VSTGNSFAAPHLAGITALTLSKHRQLTPFQLKSALYLAATNVARREGGSHDAQ
jgi:subtilisin family serine protease